MKLETFVEEFKDTYKIYSLSTTKPQQIEVWVNPVGNEMRDAGGSSKYIRWVADHKNKKLYVWNGYKITHNPKLLKQLKLESGYANYKQLSGTYNLKNKEIGSDLLFALMVYKKYKEEYKKFKKLSYKWVDKYIPGFNEFIKTAKKEDL